jgi:Tfp pilus assembly protein PilX
MRVSSQRDTRRNGGWPLRRGGLALMVVLVALAIVSAIALSLLRISVLHHRQAERETSIAQTRWLAESALDRAAAQLRQDAQFTGTKWSIPAQQLDGRHAAEVAIEVRLLEDAPQTREVIVVADFPANSPQRSRTRLVRRWNLPPKP